MQQEIILKNLETPPEDIDKDIHWLCKSFGFVTPRDKDETVAKVLHTVVTATAERRRLSSDQIAMSCDVSRAAVLYHIRNYMISGIIVSERRAYVLRAQSIRRTIEEIELDALRIFTKLKKVARDIDTSLGLE